MAVKSAKTAVIANAVSLGEDQQAAFDAIKKFLKTKEVAFSLCGSAGTGKSTMIKTVVDYIRKLKIPYVLCAPTHKAKLVLSNVADEECLTLHKLLSLSPQIDILHLDFNDLKFQSSKLNPEMPLNGILICDEASMINDDLFDLLISKCKQYKDKIIFVSDEKQIQPVNNGGISKVFSLPNKSVLNKVYRQKDESALMPIFQELRDNHIDHFITSEAKAGSLVVYDDIKGFADNAVKHIDKSIKKADVLNHRILAWTNAQVDNYNLYVRKSLFKTEQEYHKNEFLTSNESFVFNHNEFYNSMDYIIIDKPKKVDIFIPEVLRVQGYQLNLYDTANKSSALVNVISRDISKDEENYLAMKIEDIRVSAIQAKKKKNMKESGRLWNLYFRILDSFTYSKDLCYDNRLIRKKTFSYGYASSVHKSQGSSYNSVSVDIKNINLNKDLLERKQLQYVALSRTRSDAFIFQ